MRSATPPGRRIDDRTMDSSTHSPRERGALSIDQCLNDSMTQFRWGPRPESRRAPRVRTARCVCYTTGANRRGTPADLAGAFLKIGRRPRTRTGPVPVPETGGALPPHVSVQVLVRPRGFEPPGPSASDWGVYRSCATAADPWCPVRESHPHRLDVSEVSCCWKNRTKMGSGTLSRTGCRRLMKPSETRSSVPQRRKVRGGLGGIRTHRTRVLSAVRLPVAPRVRTGTEGGGPGRTCTSKTSALEAAASADCATGPWGRASALREAPRPSLEGTAVGLGGSGSSLVPPPGIAPGSPA